MLRYIAKRLGYSVLVLVGVSVIAFGLLRLAPGNPARLMLPEGASEQEVAALAEKLGLNKPLITQYLLYMRGVVTGDLGTSLFYKKPNLELITQSLGPTFVLTTVAIVVALCISIPLGIVAALKKGTVLDFVAMFFALLGQSMSPVWLGVLLIYIFSVSLGILPAFGYGKLSNLVMPAITLGTPLAALTTRLTRAGMFEVLQEDYILAARARGLPFVKVVLVYALKNVLIPVVTVVGLQFGTFLGGAIVTEQIFNWPGIGRLSVSAVMSRDFPLVQACILVVSALFVFVNLAVDIIYTWIDPRVRLG